MRRKVLIAILALVLVSILASAGVYAYFSDTAKSTENTFTAGTFDLMLSVDGETWTDDVSATWTPPDGWAPGMSIAETLYVKNTGTLNVVTIKIKPTDLVDLDGLASQIIITEFTLFKPDTIPEGGKLMEHMEGQMATWGIWGTEAPLTLAEFASGDYWFVSGDEDGIIKPNSIAYLTMEFEFDTGAGEEYEGTTCSFDLTINAVQGPSDHTVVGDCGYGH